LQLVVSLLEIESRFVQTLSLEARLSLVLRQRWRHHVVGDGYDLRFDF